MEKRVKFSLAYYVAVLAAILAADLFVFSDAGVEEISYKQFRDRIDRGEVANVVITHDRIYGEKKESSATDQPTENKKDVPFSLPTKKTPWRLRLSELEKEHERQIQRQFTVVPLEDPGLIDLLQSHGVDYRSKVESNWVGNLILNWILPFGVMFLVWGFLFRRIGRGPTFLNVGQNKSRIYEADPSKKVTFDDVAGIDEAVEEVKEIADFLKNPGKYARLGAKLPKGVLLVGPPGTGKTLLARAVAGDAGVPFFSLTGSDFVEMFVGVGAARVRDLFAEAKKAAPCIIFIDELDAVGKSRGGAVPVSGYDERENTLNQLLAEMDGFDPQLGIVMMGATNRPEILDLALLRPGRFDRQILVDRPDFRGRVQIFGVHVRPLVLAGDVDLTKLAGLTPGFAGAEIANLCNEAALLANRKAHQQIEMGDFLEAVERVVAGLEKKNKLINPRERQVVSFHESGHAIVGHFTLGADPVRKVSIVPRGIGALGYTLQSPLEDRYLLTRAELLGRIKGLLAGRAAEQITFGEISTGASDDLQKANRIARDMITTYGMSKRLPNVSLVDREDGRFLGQGPFTGFHSEKLEQAVDDEVQEIIAQCYEEDTRLLSEKKEVLEQMALRLQAEESINEKGIVEILGPRPATPVDGKVEGPPEQL